MLCQFIDIALVLRHWAPFCNFIETSWCIQHKLIAGQFSLKKLQVQYEWVKLSKQFAALHPSCFFFLNFINFTKLISSRTYVTAQKFHAELLLFKLFLYSNYLFLIQTKYFCIQTIYFCIQTIYFLYSNYLFLIFKLFISNSNYLFLFKLFISIQTIYFWFKLFISNSNYLFLIQTILF
jgi:hypothetical protein